jgi:tetratricopeptide (TPR) repeat protein
MSIWSRLEKIVDDWLGKWQYGLGKYYRQRGKYRDAVVAFQAAEKWYITKYGPLDNAAVASLIQQGWCNVELNRREAACRAYKRALEIIEATEGPSHPKAREIQAYVASNCAEAVPATASVSG